MKRTRTRKRKSGETSQRGIERGRLSFIGERQRGFQPVKTGCRGYQKSRLVPEECQQKQDPELVIFEFENMTDEIHKERNKLILKGIHGMYYIKSI